MDPARFLNKIERKPYLQYVEYDFKLRLDSLLRIARKICPGFTLDSNNEFIYHEACRYFAADDSCAWDLNKGLYIYGDTGVGKTIFLRIFHNLMKAPGIEEHSGKNGFELYTVNDIIDGYSEYGHVFWKNKNLNVKSESYPKPIHIAIDDLGQNSRTASYFGNQIDVISELIQRRYYAYTDNYVLTHASSNIMPSEIKEVYGKFSASRMREMFNVIPFPGSDRRK
jgi:hypothetical protein